MTPQAASEDAQTRAVRFLSVGNPDAAREALAAALRANPDDTGLLHLLLRCQQALDDPEAANTTLARLRDLPMEPETLDLLIDHALEPGHSAQARALIALAEGAPTLPAWAVARAKAKVAQAVGDLPAATAILVEAIEAAPHAAALRTLLTEILMAGGSAGHARDVLARLGLPPSLPASAAPPQPRGNRDTA